MPDRIGRIAGGLVVAQTLAALAPALFAEQTRDLASLSLEELGKIEITSFRNKTQKLSSVAGPLYVITREQIVRSGLTSVPELLRLAPGIQVARVNGSQWSISARGSMGVYSPRLLVLIDGRSIYTPIYSGVYWDMGMPLLEDIDRIEVIRGPGATIWGANAVLGVINIVTRHSKDTTGTLVVAGAGSAERATGAVRVGGQTGETSWRTWIQAANNTAMDTGAGAKAFDDWSSSQAGFRMDSQGLGGQWMLQGSASANPGSLPSATVSNTTRTLEHGGIDTFSAAGNLTGEYRRRAGETGELRVNFYFDQMVKQHTLDRTSHASTWDGTFRYDFNAGSRNAVSAGGGARAIRESVPGSGGGYFWPQEMSFANYNVFAQDEVQLIKNRALLTFGSKLEHNHFIGWGVEPSASLLVQASKRHALWVSAARSLRTPSMLEMAVRSPIVLLSNPIPSLTIPLEADLYGSLNLRNEKVGDVQAGYRAELSRQFSVTVSVYRDICQRFRSATNQTPIVRFQPRLLVSMPVLITNNLDGKSRGAESTLGWQRFGWWKVEATHTYASMRFWPIPTAATGTVPLDLFAPPRNRWTARSGWTAGRWEFDVLAYWTGAITNNSNSQRLSVPAHTRLDARLGWRTGKRWTLSLSAQNLLRPRVAEGASEMLSDNTYIKRSVAVKSTWTF